MPYFEEWESFYVIVGAAAGALIGLQFVVMTLIAERPPLRAAEGSAAFATPTIVHFSAVLLVACVLRAPWKEIASAATAWGIVGLAGSVYMLIIARRMVVQGGYRADLEDWLYFFGVPFLGYVAVGVSALPAASHPHEALFGVGGAVLLLLFVAIRNAWDAIAYQVLVNMRNAKD